MKLSTLCKEIKSTSKLETSILFRDKFLKEAFHRCLINSLRDQKTACAQIPIPTTARSTDKLVKLSKVQLLHL